MITVVKESIHTIPVLHVAENRDFNEKKPFILFYHGFTSAKEHNLHYAYLLAEEGFRVVLPDVDLHGERDQGFDEVALSTQFWKMVIRSIKELEAIKDHYVREGLADEERIGLVGSSMGGIITLGALSQFEWIKAGVSLMGSPAYVNFARAQIEHFKNNGFQLPMSEADIATQLDTLATFDLSLQPEALNRRPIMFWHGTADTVVPFGPTYAFYKSILPQYEEHPDRIRFVAEEGEGHKVSRNGLMKTVSWFKRHL